MLDITERKRAESTIERSARYHRALIENALDIITVVDHQGIVQYQSPAAERLLGHAAEDRRGRSVFEQIHPDDLERVRAVFHNSITKNEPSRPTQFRSRHADGTWRILEAIGRPFVDDDGGRLGIINSRDVTERRQLEDRFRHAQKMEALGRLTSSVAHDFSNVLTMILGFADCAAESDAGAGVQMELREIKRAGELGISLTRQLKLFSRLGASQPEVVDAHAILDDMEGMLRRLVGRAVLVEIGPHTSAARVRLGKGMLEQVLMNLAINARDAMPDGGLLRITTSSGVMPGGDLDERQPSLVIDVTDTGIGMTPEIMSRIFEPYFTTKESGCGTGLGLSTVYAIIHESHGFIEVESDLHKGTRFRTHLPVQTN